MNFETIIGIEIHCELNTKTKMFSSAPNTFGKEPNTQVSRVDMAFPGILPTVNKKAVEYAIMACSALNLSIDNELWFDRKNYFYSDLPKGYQITQDKRPIGRDGYIEVDKNFETSIKNVYAGGDLIGEKATVAWAARSGRDAAYSIIKKLKE